MRAADLGRWAVAATALILFSFILTEGAASQAPGPERAVSGFTGGPFVGASTTRVSGLEYGARLGVRRGAWAVDASGSVFDVAFVVPPETHRTYEVLAGLSWYPFPTPYVPGIGLRAGGARTPNAFGDRSRALVLGPHTTIDLPVGRALNLRGEAGVHLYVSGLGPGGPRGYLRFGVEAKSPMNP